MDNQNTSTKHKKDSNGKLDGMLYFASNKY